ncbi:hypothetical protein ATS75_18540 [Pseudoalteromonas sp. H105]|nr:hypothetical protein ATS75_18540 [Pseudoalteromonas sp. H105]
MALNKESEGIVVSKILIIVQNSAKARSDARVVSPNTAHGFAENYETYGYHSATNENNINIFNK